MLDEHLEEFAKSQDNPDVALSRLKFLIKDDFLLEGDTITQGMDRTRIKEEVLKKIDEDIKLKLALGDGKILNQVIRMEYLRLIDQKWLEHLESLESLREAVYLRHYAQKNPLHEYRIEGFQIFEQMIYEIKTTIAKKIIKIRIQSQPTAVRPGFRASAMTTNHASAGVFGSAGSPKEPTLADRAAPRNIQIVRQDNKVGRNDPCPCGSGKKYKFCHGLNQ
jgi:preprotein translocase subunit SecA